MGCGPSRVKYIALTQSMDLVLATIATISRMQRIFSRGQAIKQSLAVNQLLWYEVQRHYASALPLSVNRQLRSPTAWLWPSSTQCKPPAYSPQLDRRSTSWLVRPKLEERVDATTTSSAPVKIILSGFSGHALFALYSSYAVLQLGVLCNPSPAQPLTLTCYPVEEG
jgi:hypothetical protein